MTIQLDKISRDTIGRFVLKLCISALIASMGDLGYILGTSWWLALYALVTAAIALLMRQRFPTKSFNHWDEAWWLIAVSQGLRIVHKTIA